MSRTPASTAKGRKAIADQMRAVAARFGATITERTTPAGHGSGAGLLMNITLNNVGASIDISDLHERHGSEGGLISWYDDGYRQPVRYFSPRFNTAVGEPGLARPHYKATSIGSWDLLAARLQAGLRHAANHTAFIKES